MKQKRMFWLLGDEPRKLNERLITILFLFALSPIALCHLFGFSQIVLAPETLLLGLIMLLSIGMGVNSTLVAYSLVNYLQERDFRDLALMLIVIDGIIFMLFHLVTNPSSVSWSSFANRERNRTIITAFAFILIPFLLFGSIEKKSMATKRQEIASVAWGLCLIPFVLFWFLLSPEPVFITSPTGEGLSGITPLALVILFVALATIAGMLAKSYSAWKKEKSRITLAYFFALILWVSSIMTFAVQTNPFHLAELLWFWGINAGFAIIAVAMLISNIIEPRRELAEAVRIRTEELEQAKRETEFYLNIWAHKVGNLLQGMTTYLDLFSASIDPDFLSKPQETAKDLSGEAIVINRQVAALLRVKENEVSRTWPVHLSNMIKKAYDEVVDTLGANPDGLILEGNSKTQVIADDFLDLVFICLFRFILRNLHSDDPLKLNIASHKDRVQIIIACKGLTLPSDAELAITSGIIPDRKHLGLEIFTAKILMTYYGGSIEFRKIGENGAHSFVLSFKPLRR
ncbi:MAG: hypothetical protein ACFE9W_03305 [Promethearchaeota archaeon]